MFAFLSRLVLRAKLKNKAPAHAKTFLSWDKIEKVALIIGSESSLNKSAIDQFIADTKKFVEVFYIETRSKEPTYSDWICFSKKDRSFLNLPKKGVESSLKNKKFDVVINTCSGTNFFSAAILSSLSAPFKCARSSRFHDADLIIRRTDPANLVTYLNDTVRYLKMIRA